MAAPTHGHPAPSGREPLNSNILNYLVYRYLQEAGFAMAASWLGREWHRDPDRIMPFAKYIKSDELQHIVQDGLFCDHVRARGDRSKHRYYFGDDHGPSFSVPAYPHTKPDYKPARDSSAELNGNGKLSIPGRHVNGDAMDTDENGYGPSEAVSEAESPHTLHAVQGLDTLTIGKSNFASTEESYDLLDDSQILNWRPGSIISHSHWSNQDSSALLIAGTNHVTVVSVEDALESVETRDLVTPLPSFDVRSMCLLGEHVAAVSMVRSEDGYAENNQEEDDTALVLYNDWGDESPEMITASSGLIFALRYNASANLLLALSTDETPLISLYRYTGHSLDVVASRIPRDRDLYDAVWMDSTRFVTCGTFTLQIFVIRDNEIHIEQTLDLKRSWSQLRYDPVCDIIALVDEDTRALRQYNVRTEDSKTQAFDEDISDFEFQPIPGGELSPGAPRLLATSTADGTVQLWNVLDPFTCVSRLNLPNAGLAMKLSFSPDGTLLAAAGYDTLVIWSIGSGDTQPKAVWRCEDEQTWRSVPNEGEEGGLWVHSLSWAVDGKKLVYTLNDQAAVISLENYER